MTLYADDTVRNLPQVQVGDEVTASYYESLAYEVKKPGTATPGATVAEEAARAKLGEKPAGAGARVTTLVATITGIDKAAGTVTLAGADRAGDDDQGTRPAQPRSRGRGGSRGDHLHGGRRGLGGQTWEAVA